MVLVVRARRHWDVKCPPRKKHMVAGKLVPTVLGIVPGIKRKHRVVIEVHGQEDIDIETGEVVESPAETLPQSTADLRSSGDFMVLRILKPRRYWGLSRDPESDSDDDDDDDDETSVADAMEEKGWVEYRKFDLDSIEESRTRVLHKTTLELQVGKGNHVEVRDFQFPDESALKDFRNVLERMRRIANEIADIRARDFEMTRGNTKSKEYKKEDPKGSSSVSRSLSSMMEADGDINLLVEIVSATDLPIGDVTSSDPYVVVWLGKDKVHKTKPISKTNDPIWTVDHGSLFILSTNTRDFFKSKAGLSFLVKDYDAVGGNEILGKVNISQDELLTATGKRVEYRLTDLLKGFDSKKVVHPPTLNIRVRPASKEDFKFIKMLHKVDSKKKSGVYADEAFVAPATHRVNRLKRESKVTDDGTKIYRIKPSPDPDRPEQDTKWISKARIEEENLKRSTKWIETGSGTLGRVYVEILRCDGLPNLDKGVPGDKTDAFCCLIYEDAIVNTDVINDELSPRWMPWSQRAFVFHMQHPSSQVLIGVFDWDGIGRNDNVGRVTIDITNFYEKTDYVLTYNLYESTLDEEREVRGTITVRIRIEHAASFRSIVLSSLKGPPPANYVNVMKKKDFRSAQFVTNGEENYHILDMSALKSYGLELQGYQSVIYYIQQALLTVILWRGHYQVNLFGCKFKLALHSLVAFIMGVLLVENLDFAPAFFLFSIGWLMLATNEQRQRNPSPWSKSATFGEMWLAMVFGARRTCADVQIDDELLPLIEAYEEAEVERKKKTAEITSELQKQGSIMDAYFAQEEQEAAATEANEETVETSTAKTQLNPLKPILLPIQKILGQVCVGLRIVRSFITWEESNYAFVITNFCFLAGLLILFVPWGFLLRWFFRIVVWVFLGPWMKLVDILVVRKLEEDGDNLIKRIDATMNERSRLLWIRKRLIMQQSETTQKLRAMKRYMFGKFIARVPQFKEYRYPDIPLQKSRASPHDDTTYSAVQIIERKHGQHLIGHMIPDWGDEGESIFLSIKDAAEESVRLETGELKDEDNRRGLFRRRRK